MEDINHQNNERTNLLEVISINKSDSRIVLFA